jgi:hypothetical protein
MKVSRMNVLSWYHLLPPLVTGNSRAAWLANITNEGEPDIFSAFESFLIRSA